MSFVPGSYGPHIAIQGAGKSATAFDLCDSVSCENCGASLSLEYD